MKKGDALELWDLGIRLSQMYTNVFLEHTIHIEWVLTT